MTWANLQNSKHWFKPSSNAEMLSLNDRHHTIASPLHYHGPAWFCELSFPAIGGTWLEGEGGKRSWVGKSLRNSRFHHHFKFHRKIVILEESDVLSLGISITTDLDSARGFPSLSVWCWVSILGVLEAFPVRSLPVSLCSVAANKILFQTTHNSSLWSTSLRAPALTPPLTQYHHPYILREEGKKRKDPHHGSIK